jgi:hypothetical protein
MHEAQRNLGPEKTISEAFENPVSFSDDEYRQLLDNAKAMAAEGVRVRETIVTDELYGLILFLIHSFVRPVESELYGLKHKHV